MTEATERTLLEDAEHLLEQTQQLRSSLEPEAATKGAAEKSEKDESIARLLDEIEDTVTTIKDRVAGEKREVRPGLLLSVSLVMLSIVPLALLLLVLVNPVEADGVLSRLEPEPVVATMTFLFLMLMGVGLKITRDIRTHHPR